MRVFIKDDLRKDNRFIKNINNINAVIGKAIIPLKYKIKPYLLKNKIIFAKVILKDKKECVMVKVVAISRITKILIGDIIEYE